MQRFIENAVSLIVAVHALHVPQRALLSIEEKLGRRRAVSSTNIIAPTLHRRLKRTEHRYFAKAGHYYVVVTHQLQALANFGAQV